MTTPADAEPAFIDYLKREGLWEMMDADRYARLWGAFTEGRTVSEREIRARVAADLRRAADGRREYGERHADAGKGVDPHDRLMIDADAFESAAAVAEDPARLLGLIPSWRWADGETASVLPQATTEA